MSTVVLVDCSNCRTPLQLPPGARSIRCALCQAVTRVPIDIYHYRPPPHAPPGICHAVTRVTVPRSPSPSLTINIYPPGHHYRPPPHAPPGPPPRGSLGQSNMHGAIQHQAQPAMRPPATGFGASWLATADAQNFVGDIAQQVGQNLFNSDDDDDGDDDGY